MEHTDALTRRGFVLNNGRWSKSLDETHILFQNSGMKGWSVDIIKGDTTSTESAGKIKDDVISSKIADELRAIEDLESEEAVEEPEIVSGWQEGGKDSIVQDTTYEELEEPKKVKLPKPGRRIKNQEYEPPEGGKIRAGGKTRTKTGKVIPTKHPYFTLTTMNLKKNPDPNDPDPDSKFERDYDIHKIIGDQPRILEIVLPCDNPDLVFVTFYGEYDSAKIKCRGDGITAEKSDGTIIECNGEECELFVKGNCKRHGILSVILPADKGLRIRKWRTTSRNTINNISSSLATLSVFAHGHIAGIPLKLTLTEKETTVPSGPAKGSKTTIYMGGIEFDGSYNGMNSYIKNIMALRAGRDPYGEFEKVMEKTYELPESPEECQDVKETFFPD